MANLTLTAAQIIVGSFDVTSFAGGVQTTPAQAVLQEVTTFASGGFRGYAVGLKNAGVNVDGFADWAVTTGIDDALLTPANLGTQYAIAISPTGGATVGDPTWFTRGKLDTFTPLSGGIGEAAKFQFSLTADTAFVGGLGYVGAPLVSRSTTFTGGPVTMTGPTASQKLYAALFVTAAGTTLTAKVQSAPASNFAAPTDRISFSATSATGWQFATPVSGAITDGFWRATATIGAGSFTYAVVFGIAS
jgi:hypothetical protein